MSGKVRPANVGVRVVKGFEMPYNTAPISKALTPTQVDASEKMNAGEWIAQPFDMRGLRALVNQSTVLPQCIKAYKNNIPGYGIGVRYKDDVEETPEMSAEFTKAEEIIDLLNLDMDTKEVFEDLIEAREIYGIAYLEVIRNGGGEVCQIEFIKDTPSITKTKPLEPYQDAVFWYNGKQETRPKKYMKYRQQSGGKTVYFKEFGDKRIMDKRTGLYVDELDIEYQANEILEFAIGTEPYGEVRWMGQTLSVDGMRKAENLNHNYFVNGRHTPLMIMIQGGTLTEESFAKLQMYMNDIKGENGQHAFIVLETEGADNTLDFENTAQPTIEVKDLASILQQDELFQSYLDNGRKKVQSAFLLPDLYVGYTADFNRATAQTAQEVTEKQVFQPERKSLAWTINNKLLSEFGFKYVEAYFLEPDISNPDDLVKILQICNAAGGLTPNKAKQIALEALGEVSEDYEGDWGDVPLAYSKTQAGVTGASLGTDGLAASLTKQIQKAAAENDTEIVAVMREVKKLLEKGLTNPTSGRIMKRWITDENGNHLYIDGDGGISGGSAAYAAYQQDTGEGHDEGNYQPMLTEHFNLRTDEGAKAAQEAWSKFVSPNVTQEQWDKMNGTYIGDKEAYNINKALRANPDSALEDILDGENLEAATALQEAINSNTLESDTLLTRNTGTSIVKDALGISQKEFYNIVDGFDSDDVQTTLRDFIGKPITEHGFVSTSGNPELNMFSTRPVRLEISAPKGTNALVTQNYKESEVIFGRGTTYKIEGFDKFDTDGQGYDFGLKIKVKVVN